MGSTGSACLFVAVAGEIELGARSRRRGLGDAVGDHLGTDRAAADKDPLAAGLHRRDRRVAAGDESVFVGLDAEDLGEFDRALVGRRRHREHDEIGGDPPLLVTPGVLDKDLEGVIGRVVPNLGRAAADILGRRRLFGTRHEIVEALAEGAQIGVEDGDLLDHRIVLPDEHGVLDRVHAAETAAVGPAAFAAGADALDEDDALRRLEIRRTHHVPAGDPRGVEHAFELEARDHVGQPTVAVGAERARIELLEAHRDQDRADIERDLLGHLVEVDGVDIAGIAAVAADQDVGRVVRVDLPLVLGHLVEPAFLPLIEVGHEVEAGRRSR